MLFLETSAFTILYFHGNLVKKRLERNLDFNNQSYHMFKQLNPKLLQESLIPGDLG